MKIILPLLFIFVVVGAGFWFYRQRQSPAIHYHAAFQVYVGDKLQNFSDLKYMELEPCTTDKTAGQENDQLEKAHLHDNVGDVVHVHRSNAVWGDLFTNLNYPIPASATALLNGAAEPNFLKLPIKPYDVLIVTIGQPPATSDLLAHAPTKSYIQSVESKSENCGKQ